MIDLATIGIVGVSAISLLIAYKAGKRSERRAAPVNEKALLDLEAEKKGLEGALERSEAWAAQLARRVEQWQNTANDYMSERDEFKKIATSHEVVWPPPPVAKARTTTLWDGRRYSNHPGENLTALAADLEQMKGKHLKAELELNFTGGWADVISRKYPRPNLNNLKYEGPPERIISEITALFKDTNHPFMVVVKPKTKQAKTQVVPGMSPKRSPGIVKEAMDFAATRQQQEVVDEDEGLTPRAKLRWADRSAPMIWTVRLTAIERVEPPQAPQIHTVQVAVVETQVVEIVKEVEVVREVTSTPELDFERLNALVEVAVEEKLHARALARNSAVPRTLG